MSRNPRRAAALLALGALCVVPLVGLSTTTATAAGAAPPVNCPPGTVETTKTVGERAQEREAADASFRDLLASLDTASADRATMCRPVREPESSAEMMAMTRERNVMSAGPMGYTPPGALRAAIKAKAVASQAGSTVPGAAGTFRPLGKTPLIADDEETSPSVAGLGLADQAGRIDDYAYDEVNKRLFSAPGTGGVWLSTDIGQSWRSVGDDLPYQSVGSIAWSRDGAAGHGTLLVLSGEASAGGNVYTGLGAFYSTDTGATWQESKGIPDGLMGFEVEVDPANPKIVYAATSQGLYRSTDAGRTYVNVKLPTGDCAGVTGFDNVCQNANWVTDVEIKTPGGVGPDKDGGDVLAAVGYRAGRKAYPGTETPQSPANGLYRSSTGAPGTFEYLQVYGDGTTPLGFAPQERVGRTELGSAIGPDQNHDFIYAIVQDAVLFNGGVPFIDAADPTVVTGPLINNTALNGIYVSSDFGDTWTRMADELELQLPVTESALVGTSQVLLYAPGIQSWYNMWIEPDPTAADANGVPTRLVFGLEEVWASRLEGTPQDGLTQSLEPASFRVIGPYFADDTCAFLDNPLPTCVTQQTSSGDLTTHPDQQSGIWVPGADGSVTLVVGNDGGTYSQTLSAGDGLTKEWGRGNQAGYNANTLLPYDASAAKDGTVAFGLQDNGSGVIRPDGKVIETFGGDGFFAAIDPDDSQVYYTETPLAAMRVTQDGGLTWTSIAPPVSAPLFSNPFAMDPLDANHLITGGPEVVERLGGPTGDWVEVFNTGAGTQVSMVELQGDAAYVGFCAVCDIINKDPETQVFSSGIATNVGGDAPPEAGAPAGWHIAAAKGLPDRYISGIAIDPADPKTVYVTLAGYANRQWWPAGSFNDKNPNIGDGHVFKSTDAGETFTDISGNLPDTPARSIEINRGQLVLGTDVGLFLSNNTSGQVWAALDDMPNVPVVSVKNMPGKPDKVVLATFGRGMYEYTFSARAGSTTPVAGPAVSPVRPATGRLPATGLAATGAAIGVLALLGGLAVRRRVHG